MYHVSNRCLWKFLIIISHFFAPVLVFLCICVCVYVFRCSLCNFFISRMSFPCLADSLTASFFHYFLLVSACACASPHFMLSFIAFSEAIRDFYGWLFFFSQLIFYFQLLLLLLFVSVAPYTILYSVNVATFHLSSPIFFLLIFQLTIYCFPFCSRLPHRKDTPKQRTPTHTPTQPHLQPFFFCGAVTWFLTLPQALPSTSSC